MHRLLAGLAACLLAFTTATDAMVVRNTATDLPILASPSLAAPLIDAGNGDYTVFCRNNPIDNVDPLGLFDEAQVGAIFMLKYPMEFAIYQRMVTDSVLTFQGQKSSLFSRGGVHQKSAGSREEEFWLDEGLDPEQAADEYAEVVRQHGIYSFYEARMAGGGSPTDPDALISLYGRNQVVGLIMAGTLASAYVSGLSTFVPGYGAAEAVRGKTVTGDSLALWQRALAVIPLAALAKEIRVARSLDEALEAAVYSIRVDPAFPGRPDPRWSIDTAAFTAGEKTAQGGLRSFTQFWAAWLEKNAETLSARNKALIRAGYAPEVDETWLRAFPEHAQFLQDQLRHHHVGRGRYAIPLPYSAHKGQEAIWHE